MIFLFLLYLLKKKKKISLLVHITSDDYILLELRKAFLVFQALGTWISMIKFTFSSVPGWRFWWLVSSGAPWSTRGSSCLLRTCSWTGECPGCDWRKILRNKGPYPRSLSSSPQTAKELYRHIYFMNTYVQEMVSRHVCGKLRLDRCLLAITLT